jgi:predicted amidohydrolase
MMNAGKDVAPMKEGAIRITCIQLEMRNKEKAEALDHVITLLNEAPRSDLILLPELWPTGYFAFHRYQRDAEPLDGPIMTALRHEARTLKTHLLTGSFVERRGKDLFNTTVLVSPEGKKLAVYRKIHLFGYQSEEKRLLTPGHSIAVARLPWAVCGIATCYDLRFPELFRLMIEAGATMFLIPSAWPHARLDAWTLFNRVRAHENLAFLFSCNGTGANEGVQLGGHSMLVDPWGHVLSGGNEKEGFVSARINPHLAHHVRREFSALEDRVLPSYTAPQ